jgi:hypothetical protein
VALYGLLRLVENWGRIAVETGVDRTLDPTDLLQDSSVFVE